MEVESVKNAIRDLRSALGWTQADLAERLDVSRQTVNALETGRYDPSLPLAFRLSKLLARPLEDLFFPDPDSPKPDSPESDSPEPESPESEDT